MLVCLMLVGCFCAGGGCVIVGGCVGSEGDSVGDVCGCVGAGGGVIVHDVVSLWGRTYIKKHSLQTMELLN